MRRLRRLLPYLAILLLALIAVLVVLRAGPLAEQARKALEAELGRELGRQVSIRRASFTLSGRVALEGVAITNRDGSPLLTTPRVVVRLGRPGSRAPLLSGPTQIREIRLAGPELTLVREPTGDWNISDLLTRRPEKPSRFRGRVLVEGGTLTILDQTRSGARTTVQEVSLKARSRAPGRLQFSLSARGEEGAFGRVEAHGQSDTAGETRISGTVSDLDLAYAWQRLPEIRALSLLAGRGQLRGEAVFGTSGVRGTEAGYHLEAKVTEAKVTFPWLRRPVENVSGTVRLADGDLHLEDLSGTLVDAPINADGTVADLSSPTLSLNVGCSGIRYRQLRALFPRIALPMGLLLPSPLRISAQVEGPASDLKVTGEATMRVIKFRAIPWNDLVGKFEYSGGKLSIKGLRAHGSPRRLEAELEVTLRKGQQEAQGSISLLNMPLSMLAEMAGAKAIELGGLVDLSAAARVDGQQPALAGTFEAREVAWRGLELGRVTGEFDLSEERLRLRNCQARGPLGNGAFTADFLPDGSYDLQARLSSLDLSGLGPVLKAEGLRGQCSGSLQLRGAQDGKRVTGWLDLGPGEIQGRTLKRFHADLRKSPTGVAVSGILLSLGEGEYRGDLELAGWQGGRDSTRLRGRLHIEGAALRDWLPPRYASLAPDATISGSAVLAGTLGNPQVSLHLDLPPVPVEGQQVPAGRASVRYQDHRLVIEEMFFQDDGTRVTVAGGYDPEAGLALQMTADPLDLSQAAGEARRKWGLALTGQAQVRAAVTGPLGNPEIEIAVSSQSFTVNDARVDELTLTATATDRIVHVESAQARQGDSRLHLSGDIDLCSGALDLSLKLDEMDLGTLMIVGDAAVWRLYRSGVRSPHFATYARLPRPLRGRLNADARIAGTMREPTAAVDLEVNGLSFAGRQINQIEGKVKAWLARADARGFSLHRAELALLASHESANASVSGEIAPGGAMSFVVDIGNLDLRLLSPWLPYPLDLGGLATINFDISGPLARPVLRGDIFVDDLRLGPVEIEAARVSPIRVERGVLTLEEIRLRDGPMEAIGTAYLPLPSPNEEPAAASSPAKAELHLRNASLAPMPGMAPAVLDADMYLIGRRLFLKDGEGPAASSPGPGIRGKMGSGTLAAEGEVLLAELSPSRWSRNQFNVTCDLRQVDLLLPEMLKAKLDGTLLLTNSPDTGRARLATADTKPLILSHAAFGIPPRGRPLPRVALPFPPDIRVRVLVGEDVQFQYGARGRPTEISLDPGHAEPGQSPTGYLDIGGELSAQGVTLQGQVEAHEGQLVFPNGLLALQDGRAWIERTPGESPRIRVSAEAHGRVGDYYVSINPTGQLYPLSQSAPLALNAATIPYLEPALVMALLAGPMVAPTRSGTRDLAGLLGEPGTGDVGGGEITGFTFPTLGSASGGHEVSLDLAFQGPARLRVGQRILERLVVSYISSLGGQEERRTLRVNYEITPLWSVGWSVDELDRTRWEAQAFVPF